MSVVRSWKPCPGYSGSECREKTREQESEATSVFQTGFIGSTGCILLFNPVILPGINGAQLHKSLNSENIIRQGTQITRIRRIYTDPCVSVFYIKNDKTQIHSLLAELSACYAKRHAGNADEWRFVISTHRKGREERKEEEQKSLRSLRLIDFHGIPMAQGNKAIGVFETGFTGSTGCITLMSFLEANS